MAAASFPALSLSLSFFYLYLYSAVAVAVAVNGTVGINGSIPIGKTNSNFVCATLDWWPSTKCDYGTCSWDTASLLQLDLSNKILINAVKAFSPLKIRLGGTLQDKLRYQTKDDPKPCPDFVKNTSQLFGYNEGCLPLSRWDELNTFFNATGAKIIFGLNALTGRTIRADGSCTGAWNSGNAASFIRYTVGNGYPIYGWELGNELSGNGVGARVDAGQYASDIINLKKTVDDAYNKSDHKPLVIGPGGFFDHTWFAKFVAGASSSLQAVTHHIYNLGPGVEEHLVERILDPSWLDNMVPPFRDLQNIVNSTPNSSAVAWVGEAGGAYNSGRNLVTNAFVFSFWYLDQLGMSSSFDTKTYCRQSLIGGNYGLLNITSFHPNPDFYSALLWHRLMGRAVLSTSFDGTKKIRAYSHCSRNSAGITLLLINLDNSTAVQVSVSIPDAIGNKTSSTPGHTAQQQNLKTRITNKIEQDNIQKDEITRQEYHLTAKDGDLHSQTVLLNGKILSVNSSGIIPTLEPAKVNPLEPIRVAPLSIVFVQMPYVHVPACS
ncbi:heparanase-like protein 3 [Andrographis paniculata]|uniref:heparanase-like protein 3 n=1 Tax=Andrographis paniculata TaxID=175694 RepID=UPI0021E89EA5|nr:heparanase-like protein 3 [Andrographis paniculata]